MVVALKAEEALIRTLKDEGVDIVAGLPCDRIRGLYSLIPEHFRAVNLTREEEGVAICAGAYLAGVKSAMLIQSSGVGNSINAICSLAKTYCFPLPILISWRGVYNEKIAAQVPMGVHLPALLKALDVSVTFVEKESDIPQVGRAVARAYRDSTVEAVLLAPNIWDNDGVREAWNAGGRADAMPDQKAPTGSARVLARQIPTLARYEIIEAVAPFLDGNIVVGNLGVPSKELYNLKDQPSNFYMLGSMGLATPLGLGIAMNTHKKVVVIDGDGSLLMNPGSLATVAQVQPKNLTILAIDNGCHGSTGGQPTATANGVDLVLVARGFGLKNARKIAGKHELAKIFFALPGPDFIHVLAKPGNAPVPDIDLPPETIKKRVMAFLGSAEL